MFFPIDKSQNLIHHNYFVQFQVFLKPLIGCELDKERNLDFLRECVYMGL